MKSKVFLAILVVLCVASSFILASCTPKNDELPNILSIQAKLDKTVNYKIGDVFDKTKVIVTAVLDDETKRNVETTASLIFAVDNLNLDKDGKFKESGTFTLNINYSTFSTSIEITVAE